MGSTENCVLAFIGEALAAPCRALVVERTALMLRVIGVVGLELLRDL